MKPIKHLSVPRISSAVALAVLNLVANVAPAATVNAIYNAATDVPVTAGGYTATGNTVNFTLNFSPATGTDLMVVQNTGLAFINGTFDNLTNGQPVALSYGGVTCRFVANYYGGSGNDLVLTWASQRPFAWGANTYGQVSDGASVSKRLVPGPLTTSIVLAGKTVVAIAAGNSHCLVACSDGTLASWGWNYFGQLGDGTLTNRSTPMAVNTTEGASALYGKTVVGLAGGFHHSLALCSDGTVAAWGWNQSGQLGDNSTNTSLVPVAVNVASGVSALYGKTVVAITAGDSHSLALCSDGTVAGWGSVPQSPVPVAINTDVGVSALYGKTVVAIAAGSLHSLALCSDGTVAAWGKNGSGQLGDNTFTDRPVPVAVNTNAGVSALYGKRVVVIAAGSSHSLALCSDGTVAAWGANSSGQLGNNAYAPKQVPVAVNTNAGVSALYGKKVVAIAAGSSHSLALCLDGTLAAWGYDRDGELGDNTSTFYRMVPVAVNRTALAASQCFARIFSGSQAMHNLALVAAPSASEITQCSAQAVTNTPFQFTFTNTAGAFFGVVATTNPAFPMSNWAPLDGLTEVSPGQFQFTDPRATNSPQCFYRVCSP